MSDSISRLKQKQDYFANVNHKKQNHASYKNKSLCRSITSNFFSSMRLAITIVLLSASQTAASDPFFNHVAPNTVHSGWSSTTQSSHEHSLGFSFPFLGTGEKSAGDTLYISNFGAVSYNSMGSSEVTIDDAKNNIVLAAFFSKTSGATGTVKVEELLIPAADNAILGYDVDASFTGTNGLLVTWEGVADPGSSEDKADFQLYIVTDSAQTYAVFNYKRVDFSEVDHNGGKESAKAGVYVESEDLNICYHQLNSTLDRDAQLNYINSNNLDFVEITTTSNCATNGRWVLKIGEEIPCVTQFETACGQSQAGDGTTYKDPYFQNGAGWDFFMRYTCLPTLIMSADINGEMVTTKDNYCLYDADYYTSQWSCQTNNEDVRCVNVASANKLELQQVFTGFPNGQNLTEFWVEDSDPQTQARKDMEKVIIETIKEMLEAIGLSDTIATDFVFEKISVNRELSDDGNMHLNVEYTLNVISGDVESTDVQNALQDHLEESGDTYDLVPSPEVDVKDKTEACMTMCLGCKNPGGCPGTPPILAPDKCCGTCKSLDWQGGKPYNTQLKMCCHDTYVYDPALQTCCNDDVTGPYLQKGLCD